MLVQIMLVYYGLPMIGIEPPVPAFLGSAGNRVMYGIIALTINSGGYICEIIRSGIESISSATPMTMTCEEAWIRFVNSLPKFGRIFFTACGTTIIIIERTGPKPIERAASICPGSTDSFNTISSNGRVFTPLIVIAFLYFVMTFTVGRGVHAMEKHFKKADR